MKGDRMTRKPLPRLSSAARRTLRKARRSEMRAVSLFQWPARFAPDRTGWSATLMYDRIDHDGSGDTPSQALAAARSNR